MNRNAADGLFTKLSSLFLEEPVDYLRMGGRVMITINQEKCTGCGGCIDLCPSIAISMIEDKVIINPDICSECQICVKVCPVNAPTEEG